MSVPHKELVSAVQHFRENVQAATGRWWTIDALRAQLYHYYDFQFVGFDSIALMRAIQSIGQTTWTVNGGNTTGFHTRSLHLKFGQKRRRVHLVYMCSNTGLDPIGGEPGRTEWRRIFKYCQIESEYLRDIPSFVMRAHSKELNETDLWIAANLRAPKSPVFQTDNVVAPEAILPSQVSDIDSSPGTANALNSPSPTRSTSPLQEQERMVSVPGSSLGWHTYSN